MMDKYLGLSKKGEEIEEGNGNCKTIGISDDVV